MVNIVVRTRSQSSQCGVVEVGGMRCPGMIGRGGLRARKREGDGASPVGAWPLRCVLYRADRVRRPVTRLPVRPVRRLDGWCDAPGDRNYNRLVRLPYAASAETLWRKDHLYDLVVVLGHNDRPRVQGGGSAIFLHVARALGSPTAGCLALSRPHLARVLAVANRRSAVVFGAGQRPVRRTNRNRVD